jgi:hypothetical protein
MLSKLRRHLSYANVAATLALVFSMSGAALAANHYLINSTKQINPKVLRKLKGNSGSKGATGATGTAGAAGAAGAAGKEGPVGPSHTYSNESSGVAKVTVPAGTYSIHGFGALFVADAPHPGLGYCELVIAGKPTVIQYATVPNEGSSEEERNTHVIETFGEVEIPNQAAATLKSGGSIEEVCGQVHTSLETIHVENTSVEAIQVGGLN